MIKIDKDSKKYLLSLTLFLVFFITTQFATINVYHNYKTKKMINDNKLEREQKIELVKLYEKEIIRMTTE